MIHTFYLYSLLLFPSLYKYGLHRFRLVRWKMERLGKEWLWRRIYQGTLRLGGKDTLVPPQWVEKVRTKENADELFLYLINDPDLERPWHYGVFIVHMKGMREQLRGREFEQHKDWVFNNHSDKVPSFKELLRVDLIILIRCCTRVVL